MQQGLASKKRLLNRYFYYVNHLCGTSSKTRPVNLIGLYSADTLAQDNLLLSHIVNKAYCELNQSETFVCPFLKTP